MRGTFSFIWIIVYGTWRKLSWSLNYCRKLMKRDGWTENWEENFLSFTWSLNYSAQIYETWGEKGKSLIILGSTKCPNNSKLGPLERAGSLCYAVQPVLFCFYISIFFFLNIMILMTYCYHVENKKGKKLRNFMDYLQLWWPRTVKCSGDGKRLF